MKRITYLAFTIFITLSLFLMTQDCFASQWARTYGGGVNDFGESIQQTTDGGYIVAGRTKSFGAGSEDIWILKLDSGGNVSWQKTYGGGVNDFAESIQQTSDGGYIVAGLTNSFGAGSEDIWILKLDASGNVSWQKTYGGGGNDEARSIQQTTDGGYIVAGLTESFGAVFGDFWVLKLDSGGNVSWQKTYGGGGLDQVRSIQQTTDGGYIVAGQTSPSGAEFFDLWVLKLDAGGSVSWQKAYGGSSSDYGESIQQTTDGGYIVAGRTNSFGAGSEDIWILKLDASGNVSWQKTYGGVPNDFANSIQQTTDGGYIVAGLTESFGAGGFDFWVLKLDSGGNVSWQKTYGGGVPNDFSASIQQTTDGGYIVAGLTESFGAGGFDFWVLKLDSNGNINNCDIPGSSNVTGIETAASVITSTATVSTPSPTSTDTSVIPQASTAEVETQCFVHDWFPAEPPSQDKLNGVWGYLSTGPTPTHKFYAVGESGRVHHFDGTSWSGTGTLTSYDLNGVWGSSGDDIHAVGDNCTIFHYDSGWTDDSPGLFSNNLNDVWGSSSNDVYAVGDGGKIARYYNGSWSEVTHGLTIANLTGIWGSASDDYVAVGEGGKILNYNGYTWAGMESGTTADLKDVWGSTSDNIYAVGTSGTIIHFDGATWSPEESPTAANLRGIWGSSEDNIYAVGDHGSILYYDGVSWQKLDSGVQDSLVSTFGTLNPRVMVVGYDGNILILGGPSVQGKICNSCTGEGIDGVTVDFDLNGVEYQEAQTDEQGIYPSISSQGGPYPLLFTATDYLTKAITVDLPFNSSIVDHATYLLPNPGYQDCLSGTIKRTVLIGTIPKENKRGVQNMEVKLYQGDTVIESTTTDVGGNYHFTGLSSGTYKVEPVIVASECTADPPSYLTVSVPTTNQYDFELSCPETPPSTEAYWQEMTSNTDSLLHGIWGSSGSNIFAVGDNGVIIKSAYP